EPKLRPSRPEPPTRRMSRRVTPSSGSHRSFPARPGTMIIVSLPGRVIHVVLVNSVAHGSARISNKYCIESDRSCPAENVFFSTRGGLRDLSRCSHDLGVAHDVLDSMRSRDLSWRDEPSV